MPGASLLDGALKWDPGARRSAEDLRVQARAMFSRLSVARNVDSRAPGQQQACAPSASGQTSPPPDLAESQGEPRHQSSAHRVAAALGPSYADKVEPTPARMVKIKGGCQCRGHCYTSGHRYAGGCDSQMVCEGSHHCTNCKCCACDRPRWHGPFCHGHKHVWDQLT